MLPSADPNTPLSVEDRKRLLADALRATVVRDGGAVQSQNDFDAVVSYGKPVNHTLHLLISVFTCALWAVFVWPWVALFGGQRRAVFTVDEYGRVHKSKLGKR